MKNTLRQGSGAPTDLLGLDGDQVWTIVKAFDHLKALGIAFTKRTVERRLNALGLLPPALEEKSLTDDQGNPPNSMLLDWSLRKLRAKRRRVFFCQLKSLPNGRACLHANDARNTRLWVPLHEEANPGLVAALLQRLQSHLGSQIAVVPSGELVGWLKALPSLPSIEIVLNAFLPTISSGQKAGGSSPGSPVLRHLENETIFLIREAVATSVDPLFVFTGSKNSSVLLHLIGKAFFPARPPVRLATQDANAVFPEIAALCRHLRIPSLAEDGEGASTGSTLRFIADASDGASPDGREHKRVGTTPFWNLVGIPDDMPEKHVSAPLSGWSDLDLWRYIDHEGIPVLPLYFSQPRLTVTRDGQLFLVNDPSFKLLPGEQIAEKTVRIDSLSAYPSQGVVVSAATSVPEIILEQLHVDLTQASQKLKHKKSAQRETGKRHRETST